MSVELKNWKELCKEKDERIKELEGKFDLIVERLETIEDSLFNQRALIGDAIWEDKDAHQRARNLLLQEIAYNNAIAIVKEVGGIE